MASRPQSSASRANSTVTSSRSFQPARYFSVNGIVTARRTSRNRRSTSGRSRNRPDPPLHRTTLFTVTENLVAQKLIPPMIHVMISPGTGPRMRSIQYDTVSDRFGRYLLEEVLPEVEKTYKLRADGYSRGIAGESSGAICALNVAWHFPEKFSRVHSTIGSYTALQWHPEEHLDGANVYPFLIRKEPRKNIRIWQSDGMDDIENQFGSWPLQAVELANSLKM